MLYKRFTITFDSGKIVPAVRVPSASKLEGLADLLNLPPCNGTIAVVGGAAGFDDSAFEQQRQDASQIFHEVVALAARKKLIFVDGGTPYGVMRLLAQARSAQSEDSPPLVGVAPLGQVRWPGCSLDRCGETDLDATHSAFVLVETDRWGGETDTLAAVAHELAPGHPRVELLVNGGDIARLDADAFLRRGGDLVVLEGSGRFADELAAAVKAGHSDDPELRALLSSRRVHAMPVNTPPREFVSWLENLAGW
jgi:hypothetical protein